MSKFDGLQPEEELAMNRINSLSPGIVIEFYDPNNDKNRKMIVDDRRSEAGTIPLLGRRGGMYRLSVEGNVAQFETYSNVNQRWQTFVNVNVSEVDTNQFD